MGETPPLSILLHDEDLVCILKPAGFHVHQPERPRRRVATNIVCLAKLRDQIGAHVHPVHRLDVATSGALLFALTKDAASQMGQAFRHGRILKTYYAIVRGHPPDAGEIDEPLRSDSSDEMLAARTTFETLARAELPALIGRRRLPARYALVRARPETGRFHQIRRHFARKAHPLIGDAAHGDSYHNRFFREELGVRGLMLQARGLKFLHPRTGEPVEIEAPFSDAFVLACQRAGLAYEFTESRCARFA